MNQEATIADVRGAGDSPPAPAPRSGGLRIPPKGEMPPVFTVILAVALIEVLTLIFLPFLLHQGTESPWADSGRLAFCGVAVLSGLLFGTLVAVVAERRNHSPWWFLAGQLGVFTAPFLAMGPAGASVADSSPLLSRLLVFALGTVGAILSFAVFHAYPRQRVAETGPLLHLLGRFFHAAGNIWFGIALLFLLTASVFAGGWWETHYGARSAHHLFYTGPWFGLLFLAFAVSLISATLRKYPFRVDQTGWITVHTALVLLILGSFMSFWGKKEGELALDEGQQSASFSLDTETRLVVEEARRLPDGRRGWREIAHRIADFDLNPARIDADSVFEIGEHGESLFRIQVDRYFANARPRTIRDNNGPAPLLGITGEIIDPAGGFQSFSLAEGSQGLMVGSMLGLDLRRPPHPEATEALRSGRDRGQGGRVVVKDASGQEVLALPVSPGERPAGEPLAPAPLGLEAEIPGTGLRLRGVGWYDDWQLRGSPGSQQPVDANPGRPYNPAVAVVLDGPEGEDGRWAFSWYPDLAGGQLERSRYPDYRVYLDYFEVPGGALMFIPDGREALQWIFQPVREPRPRAGPVVPGGELDLGIPLKIRIDQIFDRFREVETYDFVGYSPERQVIRLQIEGDDHHHPEERWLSLGEGAQIVHKDGREFRVRWKKTESPLGFELKLHDFHRDFYPGSMQERTFESYLRLWDTERFPQGVDIKVDMNHPLRFRGWRLYQSRFSTAAGETTFLQVNRDPGLGVTYAASALLTLGLVIVFFQKRPFLFALKSSLARRGAPPHIRFAAALGVVLLAFASTVPGILVITLLPEGPVKGIGAMVVVIGLVLETLGVNIFLTRRLKRSAGASVREGRMVGAAS